MAIFSLIILLLHPSLSSTSTSTSTSTSPSPYLSPSTIFQNYRNMLTSFKIYIYTPSTPLNFPKGPSSLFHTSLLRSKFLTNNPNEAHLYFVPFSPNTSTRSLARLVRDLRNTYPYWNRTLGADHFFISPAGIDYSSDRNALELKKNSIQISEFPVSSGYFIPHKDVALPPISNLSVVEDNSETPSFLCYLKWNGESESDLVNELKEYGDFLVDERSEPLDYLRSKFCLFFYGGDVAWMVEAMANGCVPVVIVDRPIQDLPLMDVLRWSDVALVVKVHKSGAGRLRELLLSVVEEKFDEMRGLGVAASRHLVWNAEDNAPQPLDAFHMVIYQLWLRRHVVRYTRREFF